jgi:hypothetical protein
MIHAIVGAIALSCVVAGFILGIIYIIENIRNK